MTVERDLERALAMTHQAQGTYALWAADTEDENAREVYQGMARDMERHAAILESRLQYLNHYNQLNGHPLAGDAGNGAQGQKSREQKTE